MWNLFLDDLRDTDYVKDNREYVLARSFDEAVKLCKDRGCPTHISFDHDLGLDKYEPEESGLIIAQAYMDVEKSGYDFAKWLVDQDLDGSLTIPEDFTWYTHSSNPVGKANIDGLLTSYLKAKKQ